MRTDTSWPAAWTRASVVPLAVAASAVSISAILVRYNSASSIVIGFYRALFTTERRSVGFQAATRSERASAASRSRATSRRGSRACGGRASPCRSRSSRRRSSLLQPPQRCFSPSVSPPARSGRRWSHSAASSSCLSAAARRGEHRGPVSLYGNALAVVAAVCMVGYVLTWRSLRQRIPLVPYVVAYSISAVALFGFADGGGH